MAIDTKTVKSMDFMNFSEHADILHDWIKKHWDIGKTLPKGWKEFIKDYEDFDGMLDLDEKKILSEFKGFNDSSATSPCFPIKMSLPHVAYNDKGQALDPLRTLIASIFSYGIAYGQKLEDVYENSNMNYKLRLIAHCSDMMSMKESEAEKATYQLEIMGLKEPGCKFNTVGEKWDKIRKDVEADYIVWKVYTEDKKNDLWHEINKLMHQRYESYNEKKKKVFGPHKDIKSSDFKTLDAEFGNYVFMKYYLMFFND